MTEYDITPVPKPRMTRRDMWQKRPAVQRYWAFKDQVKALGLTVPVSGADVVFVMPMPRSWSKKKRAKMDGQPHQQTPDIDNLLKALLDAIFECDATVYDIGIHKRWGERGKVIVV